MKNMVKVIVFMGAILLSVSTGACRDEKDGNGGDSGESQKSKTLAGRYYNEEDSEEYIDLKDDGMVFLRERAARSSTEELARMLGEPSGEPKYTETAGKWKVYGNEITLIGPLGDVKRGQIKGNTILAVGKVWVGRGEPRKPTKDNIPGNYILEGGESTIVFRKDGTIRGWGLAQWKIENGFVQLYAVEGYQIARNGTLEGDDIVIDVIREDGKRATVRFTKQDVKSDPTQEQPQIKSERSKAGGIGSIPQSETLWVKCNNKACNGEYKMSKREYYRQLAANVNPNPMATGPTAVTCEKCNKPSLFAAVKCPNPGCGVVFIEGSSGPGDFGDRCPKCGQSEVQETMKRNRGLSQGADQVGTQTLDRSQLSQQINRRRGLFADASAFPKPYVSLSLRASASGLVERVEAIHLAALDYQYLSLKSLRFASTSLEEGELARAKYYIEKADRYYRVAVALQRDSQSVLDGTYSAAETATKGVKDACQTATTLGLKVINPVAGKVVDYIYVGIDYGLERAVVGADEAGKNTLKRLLVKALFEEVKFAELGNRTIASYVGDSIGKDVFPLLDRIFGSEEAKVAILTIIKESGVKVSEEVLLRTILGKDKEPVNNARQGLTHAGEGEYEKAISEFTNALKTSPKSEIVYANRGIAYYHMRDYDRAISDYSKAIELNPRYAEAYHNRANAHREKGEYDEAIADFSKAIEINPGFAATYYNRGIAHEHKGEFDRAIADYTKAIGISQMHAGAYCNRGRAYGRKEQYEQAMQDWNKAIEINPSIPEPYINRAVVNFGRAEYDKSWQDVNKAQSLGAQLPPDFLEELRKASGRER